MNEPYWPKKPNGERKKIAEMTPEERRRVAQDQIWEMRDAVVQKGYSTEEFDRAFAEVFGVGKA